MAERRESPEAQPQDEATESQTTWGDIEADPDIHSDLGYHIDEWRIREVRAGGRKKLMFLPTEDAEIPAGAFVVADPRIVQDTYESR